MRTFNTRNDLAAASLIAGQLVMTKGLAAAGDQGGQVYYIVAGPSPDDPTSPDLVNNVHALLQYAPVQSVVAGAGIEVFLLNGRLTIALDGGTIWDESLWDTGEALGVWDANGQVLTFAHALTGPDINTLSPSGISGHDNEDIQIDIDAAVTGNEGTIQVFVTTDLGNTSVTNTMIPGIGGVDQGGGVFRYTVGFTMSSVNGSLKTINLLQEAGSNYSFNVVDVRFV